MADVVTEYLKASDNSDDYAQSLIDGLDQQRLEDVDNLFTDTANRDVELWEELDVNPETTIEEYEETDVDARGFDWSLGLAGLATASSLQFFLDQRKSTIIRPVAYREQLLDPFHLTTEQLVLAGKRSTEFEGITAFQSIQTKYLDELSFLNDLDSKALYNTLEELGALRPPEQLISDSMGYVTRMTNYPQGSVQWKEEVANLVDSNSKRAVQMQNRRSVERLYSYRAADGDLTTLMVWIGEQGGHTCAYCPNYYGDIRTYAEWIESGILPGASVCAGGDRCRCHLEAAGLLAA